MPAANPVVQVRAMKKPGALARRSSGLDLIEAGYVNSGAVLAEAKSAVVHVCLEAY